MLWSVIASAVAALGGAWAGAHFALRRFKRERAHEERFEWYLDTVQALNEVKFAFGETEVAIEAGRPPEEISRRLDAARGKMMAALKRTHQARIFASQSTVDALKDIEKEIQAWNVEDVKGGGEEELKSGVRRLKDLYGSLVNAVADDARTHLELEAIEA